MTYRTIVADPPWPEIGEKFNWQRPTSRQGSHYGLMTIEEICWLAVANLAARDSYLWLWIPTYHKIRGLGVQVMEAWGFRPTTELIWKKSAFSLGFYLRNQHETALLGIRGSPGTLKRRDAGTVFEAPRRRHSEKPAEFFSLVESLCDGPYLELFARTTRPGWDAWGNEIESTPGVSLRLKPDARGNDE